MRERNHGGYRVGSGRKSTNVPTIVMFVPAWFKQPIADYITDDTYTFNYCDYLNNMQDSGIAFGETLPNKSVRVPKIERDNIKNFVTKGRAIYKTFDSVTQKIGNLHRATVIYNACDTEKEFFSLIPYDLKGDSEVLFTVDKVLH